MESDDIKIIGKLLDPVVDKIAAKFKEQDRRLDAIEAAHNTLTADVEDMKPHDASGYTLPIPATESVGERIATKFALWEKRGECAAAIDAAVADAHQARDDQFHELYTSRDSWKARAEKAEAEVKRLSDPGWITHMSCHNSTYAAFARHVKGVGRE